MMNKFITFALAGGLLLVGAGCTSGASVNVDGQASGDQANVNAQANINSPSVACTLEAKICPDGTSVGRVPPTCEFAPCPPMAGCTKELKVCPDGATVGRLPPSCEFAPCPGDGFVCPQDVQQCPDGSYVSRKPPACQFEPCPAPTPTACKNQCGNGQCQEVVCEAVGCPCAESAATCPQDCKP